MPIVEGVASLTSADALGRSDRELAKKIEAAMSAAVHQALADGVNINDSNEIRERMLAARGKVLRGEE